jgi:hypothetical protein
MNTTTDNRSTQIKSLAEAASLSEQVVWETVKDIYGAYDRPRLNFSGAVRDLAAAMWLEPATRFDQKSLALLAAAVRSANGFVVKDSYTLVKDEWDRSEIDLICDHPLCDRLHKRGCPTPGGRIWVSWIFMNDLTGDRNVPWQISDNFDRKRDALEALERFRKSDPGDEVAR